MYHYMNLMKSLHQLLINIRLCISGIILRLNVDFLILKQILKNNYVPFCPHFKSWNNYTVTPKSIIFLFNLQHVYVNIESIHFK